MFQGFGRESPEVVLTFLVKSGGRRVWRRSRPRERREDQLFSGRLYVGSLSNDLTDALLLKGNPRALDVDAILAGAGVRGGDELIIKDLGMYVSWVMVFLTASDLFGGDSRGTTQGAFALRKPPAPPIQTSAMTEDLVRLTRSCVANHIRYYKPCQTDRVE